MSISLSGRVALVTGAGEGLGRAHALALAARGARVWVNDLGANLVSSSAEGVANEIREAGGEAQAVGADVSEPQSVADMIATCLSKWQRIDILVNNAGILRDKSFGKMTIEEFSKVMQVHVMGAVHCTKAVWPTMLAQSYGRIIFTTSSSGLFGNFGQSNYSAAKMALVGLMQTLGLEGARHDIRVNCLAPTAATRMMQGIVPKEVLDLIPPSMVSPAIVALASDHAPTRTIVCAGAGSFEVAHITMTQGVYLGTTADAAECLLKQIDALRDRTGDFIPTEGRDQASHELGQARNAIENGIVTQVANTTETGSA